MFDRLFAVVFAWADTAQHDPDLVKVFLNWSASFQTDLETRYHRYLARVVEALQMVVRERRGRSEFGPNVDPRDAALINQASGNVIAHLKFSGYDSEKLGKFLTDVVRGALQIST